MGVRVDTRELEKFSAEFKKLGAEKADTFMAHAVRECAGRMLSLVIPATPVGDSRQDADGNLIHVGGALRRAWTCRTEAEANAGTERDPDTYAASLPLVQHKRGGQHSVKLVNPMHYASYVEYGHRQTPGRYVPAIGKRLVNSFVEGQHFLEQSEDAFREKAPETLQLLLDNYLKQVF